MEIDSYSYACGVIDCFNEIVRAGVKRIALSHPEGSREGRDRLIPFSQQICSQYGTKMYIEDDPLITDLFPYSMNLCKYNIIYYKFESDIQEYLTLKQKKRELVLSGRYSGEPRAEIARRFGKLLSYSDEAIETLISSNNEKE